MGNGSGKELKAVAPFPDLVDRPLSAPRPSSASALGPQSANPLPETSKNLDISDVFRSGPFNNTFNTYDAEVRPPSGNSGLRARQHNIPEGTFENSKSNFVLSNPDLSANKHSFAITGFDFKMTEGQSRRNMLADCDTECSMITEFLFVSGSKVIFVTFCSSFQSQSQLYFFILNDRLRILGKHYLLTASQGWLTAP